MRAVLPAFQRRLGARVLPDDVDGAGGAKAANPLFRAKPDGTSISVLNIPGAPILQEQGGLGFDLSRLSWLGNLGRDSYGLMVGADSPLGSIEALRALGRTRPVKFTCIGPAGTAYSATRIGAKLLGIPVRVIAGYKGTNDYVVAAMRGDGDAAVASLAALEPFRTGKLIRLLATFEKAGSVPDLPGALARPGRRGLGREEPRQPPARRRGRDGSPARAPDRLHRPLEGRPRGRLKGRNVTDTDDAEASASIPKVLEHVTTMRAASVDIRSRGANGSIAHVAIEVGGHEIVREVNADGDLVSARVIEL